jgi:FkbM family methyltransferase
MLSKKTSASSIRFALQNFRLAKTYRETLEALFRITNSDHRDLVSLDLKDEDLKAGLLSLPATLSTRSLEHQLLKDHFENLTAEKSKLQVEINEIRDLNRAITSKFEDFKDGNQLLVLRYEDLVRATTEPNRARQYFLEKGKEYELMAELGQVKDVLRLLRPVRTEHPLIRLGQSSDGGYLVPDDFEGVEALFSPGVAMVAVFESDFLAKCPSAKCFQVDASVSESPLDDPRVKFEAKFLKQHQRNEADITLASWVEKYAPTSRDLVLQIDIEGAEWEVLAGVGLETLAQFRMIVIEFHGMHKVFDRLANFQISKILAKLNELFYVVHSHANNFEQPVINYDLPVPPVWEVTYLRRDRAKHVVGNTSLPSEFDLPNNPEAQEIRLDALFAALDDVDLLESN